MFLVSLILIQILIFFGLIFAFRQIMSKNVTSATKHLGELSENYDKKEQELNRRMAEAEQKSQEVINKAQEEAQKLKAQIIKEAETERDRILKQSRMQSEEIIKQADNSRKLLLSEIDERIAKEAVDRACELIQNSLPESLKQDAHTHWVKELIESGFSGLERLRLPENIKEIKITSAFSLKEEQRKILSKRLKDTLGYEVMLKEETDPKVVAGLIITIGSLVLDGSLKNKIQEQAKNV